MSISVICIYNIQNMVYSLDSRRMGSRPRAIEEVYVMTNRERVIAAL